MELLRETLPDQVFGRIAAGILAGRYAPGEKLPGQRALAEELGVNLASVREAVKRLEQLRLIEVRHGDAMRVLDWRHHGGLDVLIHVALDRDTLGAVMEARRLLLVEAARLAAERRTAAQARLLGELAEQIAEAPDDEIAQALDFAFHATLIEASGNLVFLLIANTIRDVYFERRERFEGLVSGRAELAPLYARCARAVSARDGARAARAMEGLAALQEERLR